MASSSSKKVIYAALTGNGLIAVTKFIAAAMTGSSAIFSEGVHSVVDTGNQVLLLHGLRRAKRPPDKYFPFGYGKEIYFWSFVVAILLFSMGGLFSIYEGIHKLQHPEPLSMIWVAIIVLSLAILLEAGSLFGALREIKLLRGTRPFGEWLKHTRNSELVVVLGEDIGAQVGLILALVFLTMAWVTGDPVYDAMGSICIGVVLIVISGFVAWRIRSLLLGRSADPEIQGVIEEIICEAQDIECVLNTITIQFGPDTMLAAKVKMRADLDIETAVRAINSLERELKARVPNLKWCFIEPDIVD